VVTSLAVMGYHPDSKRMMLLQTQPGVSVEQVLEATGFELPVADEVTENPPPTEEELRVLRDEVDKTKFYI
jgi:glutaconate CoA-transferase subunit B